MCTIDDDEDFWVRRTKIGDDVRDGNQQAGLGGDVIDDEDRRRPVIGDLRPNSRSDRRGIGVSWVGEEGIGVRRTTSMSNVVDASRDSAISEGRVDNVRRATSAANVIDE